MSTLASPDSGHVLLMTRDLFDNAALWWGLAACGVAQLSKLVVELVAEGRWNPRVLLETGGMPSSHSAPSFSTQLLEPSRCNNPPITKSYLDVHTAPE